MIRYITLQEARDLTRLPSHRANDTKMNTMIGAASALITSYLNGIQISVDQNDLIKVTCADLILYLNKDKSLKSYKFDQSAEELNNDAVNTILSNLDVIIQSEQYDEGTSSQTIFRVRAL